MGFWLAVDYNKMGCSTPHSKGEGLGVALDTGASIMVFGHM